MNWEYSVPNAVDQISLHDSRITSASWNDSTLTLSFQNGFILSPNLEQNPLHEAAAADCGEVVFPQCNGFNVRILTSFSVRIFNSDFCFRRRWRVLTEREPTRLAEFIAKHTPSIIHEYHRINLAAHYYECFAPSVGHYFDILTFVRLEGQKFWRPLFGTKACDRFEKKHWCDDYDIKEISFSSSSEVTLCVTSESQESGILYRWNGASPYR